MKKGRYTGEQPAYALSQAESGMKAADICRKLGISEQTFDTWKWKYRGMSVAKLQKLKQLEDENRKVKMRVADLTLDKHILQDVVAKRL